MKHNDLPSPSFSAGTIATSRENRFAIVFIVAATIVFGIAAPFAKVKLPVFAGYIPLVQGVLIVTDLLTAMMLFGLIRTAASRRILILACGYLFTALMTIGHTLCFPSSFPQPPLLGFGVQSTACLYVLWHSCFPVFVIAYVFASCAEVTKRTVVYGLVSTVALGCGLFALSTLAADRLPAVLEGGHYTSFNPNSWALPGALPRWLLQPSWSNEHGLGWTLGLSLF